MSASSKKPAQGQPRKTAAKPEPQAPAEKNVNFAHQDYLDNRAALHKNMTLLCEQALPGHGEKIAANILDNIETMISAGIEIKTGVI